MTADKLTKHNRKAQIDNVSFVTTEHQFVRSIVAKFVDAGVPVHFVSEHAVSRYEKEQVVPRCLAREDGRRCL